MVTLESALEAFNRKERNLLVRAMLAAGDRPPLPPLSERFCELVGGKLGLEIPQTAWWATDYHISWIAGALALFVNDDGTGASGPWPNPQDAYGRRLVERNQEDSDLIIATGSNLILVEAKAYGYFTNEQLESKLKRLELLHTFYNKLIGTAASKGKEIQFHFLLISPKQPKNKLTVRPPKWVCKGDEFPWVALDLPKGPIFLVSQCNEEKLSMDGGQHWYIKTVRSADISEGIASENEDAASAGQR